MVRGPALCLALIVCACADPEPHARRSALGPSDAAGKDALSNCGPITYQGCCVGDTLRYCASGKLVSTSCASIGHCGWDSLFSIYACGSSSASDPGGLPRACPSSDAGPAPDARQPDAASVNSCGTIGYAGCCLGSKLYFCSGGKVLSLDCVKSPLCGWDPSKGYYACGTAGAADPSGKNPKLCGFVPPDGGPSDMQPMSDLVRPDGVSDGAATDARVDGVTDRPRRVEQQRDAPPESSGLDPSGLEVHRRDTAPATGKQGCGCALAGTPGGNDIAMVIFFTGLAALLLRARRRPLRALLMGSLVTMALVAGGCSELTERPSRQRRPLAAADVGCPLPFEGCCDGETLWWCEKGKLKNLDCNSRPRCGWSNNKLYDCNTSGGQDPTGTLVRECSLLSVKLPPSDGGHGELKGGACRGVTEAGCCAGQQLLFCDQGQLKSISCELNPSCGWRHMGLAYDCGTDGSPDPTGRFPAACPPGVGPDTGPLRADLKREALAADRGQLDWGGDSKAPPKDCSCQIGAAPSTRGRFGWVLLGLAASLLLVRSNRRSARAAARHRGKCQRRR